MSDGAEQTIKFIRQEILDVRDSYDLSQWKHTATVILAAIEKHMIIEDDQTMKGQLVKKLKSGKRWNLRSCSFCECDLYYYSENDMLFFESSCDCTMFRVSRDQQRRYWSDLDFHVEHNPHLVQKFLEEE